MNIRSVQWAGAPQSVVQESAYLYGLDRNFLPPKSQQGAGQIVLEGPGRLETLYQYRQIEGWLGDVPVSFTYLMAYRSYEYTKQIFTKTDWNTAITNANSWLV